MIKYRSFVFRKTNNCSTSYLTYPCFDKKTTRDLFRFLQRYVFLSSCISVVTETILFATNVVYVTIDIQFVRVCVGFGILGYTFLSVAVG